MKKMLGLLLVAFYFTACSDKKNQNHWEISVKEFSSTSSGDALAEIKFKLRSDTSYFLIYDVFSAKVFETHQPRWKKMSENSAESVEQCLLETEKYVFVNWPLSSQHNCFFMDNGRSIDLCKEVKTALVKVLEENKSLQLPQLLNQISKSLDK